MSGWCASRPQAAAKCRADCRTLKIIDNAKAIEEAVDRPEIEAVPYEVGKAVDDAVSIFTFSIGAGRQTCQMLNGVDRRLRYVQAEIRETLRQCVDVAVKRSKSLPRRYLRRSTDHSYKMKAEEANWLTAAQVRSSDMTPEEILAYPARHASAARTIF